jgi:hypothetical protein
VIRSTACLAALALLVTGCSSGKPSDVVTITRTRTPTGNSSSSTTSSSAAPSTPRPEPTTLRGTCETMLPPFDVSHAIGGTALPGRTAFVVGVRDNGIGRLAYVNCRYGVSGTGSAAVAKVEIGVSLYPTDARASARITATADDYAAHGATASDVMVGTRPATMLTGGVGAGYDVPLLVVASRRLTVAVSIDPTVATGARARTDATALAELALARAGG